MGQLEVRCRAWLSSGPNPLLIEYGIGVHVDAPSNTIAWTIRSPQRVGIERLRFGGTTVSLTCDVPDAQHRRTVRVRSDAPFHLKLTCQGATRELDVPAGSPLITSSRQELPGKSMPSYRFAKTAGPDVIPS